MKKQKSRRGAVRQYSNPSAFLFSFVLPLNKCVFTLNVFIHTTSVIFRFATIMLKHYRQSGHNAAKSAENANGVIVAAVVVNVIAEVDVAVEVNVGRFTTIVIVRRTEPPPTIA